MSFVRIEISDLNAWETHQDPIFRFRLDDHHAWASKDLRLERGELVLEWLMPNPPAFLQLGVDIEESNHNNQTKNGAASSGHELDLDEEEQEQEEAPRAATNGKHQPKLRIINYRLNPSEGDTHLASHNVFQFTVILFFCIYLTHFKQKLKQTCFSPHLSVFEHRYIYIYIYTEIYTSWT